VGSSLVKLQVWDTAGQERFRTITSAYYRGADGIICVYDVSNLESFHHVQDWLQEVDRYASPETVRLLIGNKTDCATRQVTTEQGEAFAQRLQIPFLETSAKTSENVEAAFLAMASELMKQRGPKQPTSSVPQRKRVSLTPVTAAAKPSGGCC
jgi:Ras-related protein Rab-1A